MGDCNSKSQYHYKPHMIGSNPFPKPKTRMDCLKCIELWRGPHEQLNVKKINKYTYASAKVYFTIRIKISHRSFLKVSQLKMYILIFKEMSMEMSTQYPYQRADQYSNTACFNRCTHTKMPACFSSRIKIELMIISYDTSYPPYVIHTKQLKLSQKISTTGKPNHFLAFSLMSE